LIRGTVLNQGVNVSLLPLAGDYEMPIPKDPLKAMEAKQKMSIAHKNKWSEPGYREKMLKSRVPRIGWHPSDDTRNKMSEMRKGAGNHRFGTHQSEEHKRKIKEAQLRIWADPEYRKKREWINKGPNNASWKGGISFEPYCIKFNKEFKERVRAFFGYQCVECGALQNGELLCIHHVNFNKQSCCDNSIPLFVPLCKSCHGKTGHNRQYWKEHFTELLTQYYNGKCYLTKEEMEGIKL
jgi:hypothetical protein